MVTIVKNGHKVQIMDKDVCISHRTEELTGVFNFGMATSLGEGKLWI